MTSNSQVDTAGFITVSRKQTNFTAENKEETSVKSFDFQQSFARIAANANVFTVIGFGEESSEEDEKYEMSVVEEIEEDSSATEQPETEYSEDDKTLEEILDQMEREIERDIERVTTKSPEIPVEMVNWANILWKPTYIPTTIRAPCKKPKMVRFAEKVEINENEEDFNTEDPKEDNENIDSKKIIVKSHESENRREDACQKRMAYEAKKLELEIKKKDLKKKKMDYKMKKMEYKMRKMDLKMKEMDNDMDMMGKSLEMRMKAQIESRPSSFNPINYRPSSRDCKSENISLPSSKEMKELISSAHRLLF